MKVVFLGVGEAFDENVPNNSILVFSKEACLMVDCGDSAVRQLWKYSKGNHNLVDALYITHRHSDHLFGLPAMLGRFHEEKRTKLFSIICTKALHQDIKIAASYAYNGLDTDFSFPVNVIEIEAGQTIDFKDLELSFAPTRHSTPVFAIKVESDEKSVCYSGDGMFSLQEGFYKNLDLLIQETYLYDKKIIGHACITGAIKFAEDNNIKCLALVHLNKHFRKNELPKLIDKIKSPAEAEASSDAKALADRSAGKDKLKIIIPEPLDEYNL